MTRYIRIIVIALIFNISCNGQRNIKKEYYKNGNIKAEIYYKDNQKDGPFKFYFENGNIEQEGTYLEGEFDGYLNTYFETGDLETISHWTKGVNWGVNIVFYPENILHGYFLLNPYGEIMWRREYFQNGKLKLDEGNGLLSIMQKKDFKINDSLQVDLFFVNPLDCNLELTAEFDNTIEKINFKNDISDYGVCHYQYDKFLSDTGTFELNFVLKQICKNSEVINEFKSEILLSVKK